MKTKGLFSINYGKEYNELHSHRQKNFSGYTVKRYKDDIRQLVELTRPRNMLDYGSGKGYQYLKLRIHEHWGGLLPHLYDVGVRQLRERPEQKFDGLICVDVLEHIIEEDIPIFLEDFFSFLTDEDRPTFAFIGVSCRDSEAGKALSDGRPVHLTVQRPQWWRERFAEAVQKRGLKGLIFKAAYEDEIGKVVRD